jgi:hypothetical protein
MRAIGIIILFLSLLLISCDKGLSPDLAEEQVGFGGTITFSGEWNNEVKETHVILFKDPLLSVTDFNVFNLKYVSDNIPTGTQVYHYSTNDISLISAIEPGEYSYLAVAQSKRDTLSLNRDDWTVAGIYMSGNNTTQPSRITIPQSEFVDSLNIHCDFNNPPPQPPGGTANFNIIDKLLEYEKKTD